MERRSFIKKRNVSKRNFGSFNATQLRHRVASLSVHDIKRNNRENYEGLDGGTVIASLVGKAFSSEGLIA